MEEFSLPNLLIIAGTGRNSGKTTIACQVIRHFSVIQSIVAVKITPHFHIYPGSGRVIVDKPKIYIAEEWETNTGKDSSLMLEAGALQSYFVMTTDEHLEEAFNELLTRIPPDTMMICESGGLRRLIRPGLFFMMQNSKIQDIKQEPKNLLSLADRIITFDGSIFDLDINSIEITDNQWKLK